MLCPGKSRMDVCVGFVNIPWFAGLVLLLFVNTALSTKVCSNKDIPIMQRACQTENNAFQEANKNDDHKEICMKLYDMWFCVARSVPQCFSNYTIFYQSYLHSPHNCKPTPEQFRELQRIRNEGLDKIDVVPLDSTTQVSTSSQEVTERHVTKSNEEAEEEEEERKGEKKKEEKEGEHSGQKGANTGSIIHSNSVLLYLTVSMVTVLQVISGGH